MNFDGYFWIFLDSRDVSKETCAAAAHDFSLTSTRMLFFGLAQQI